MKNLFLTTLVAISFASSAVAADLSGEVSVDVAEAASGWGASTGFDLNIAAGDVANASIDIVATPGSTLTIDGWAIGAKFNSVGVSFGDQGGVFIEGYSGETLAAPAMSDSLQLSMGSALMAVGFNDATSDLTDVENLQAAYAFSLVGAEMTASVDYNLNTSNYALGAIGSYPVNSNLTIGGAVTYDSVFAFEATVETMGATAYLNGDQDDVAQNIGIGYETDLAGLTLNADVNYNITVKEFTPTFGVSFAF
jgi:hypothetical protein